MAETFTGLKLKGELGRFGKTEICDVLGVYPMPDEKVCKLNLDFFRYLHNFLLLLCLSLTDNAAHNMLFW